MSQIDLIKKQEISKADINYIAQELIDKLDTQEVSGLLLMEKFKALETLKEAIKEKLTETAVKECGQYPEKEILLYGSSFRIQEFGTKYVYDNCKDPVWEDLKEKFDLAKKNLDERQKFLQGVKGSETIVDTNTGDIVTIYPPVKTSTTGVTCSIK